MNKVLCLLCGYRRTLGLISVQQNDRDKFERTQQWSRVTPVWSVAANLSDVRQTESKSFLRDIIWYVVLVLGIPGNILSSIVWLRRPFANNSSAVYLAALAINDLVYLTFGLVHEFVCDERDWLCNSCLYILFSAVTFEPLLVLAFSIERLIAIICPLQVPYAPSMLHVCYWK